MDITLVVVGIGLTVYALVMLAAYLWLERGSFLDPIAISWAGYLLFIPIAMIGTGALFPERDTASYGKMGCILMVLGTLTYSIGLYIGKAIRFTRLLPAPRPTVNKIQLWIAWFMTAALFPLIPWLFPSLFEIAGSSAGTILYQSMASITLISVVGVLMLRGSPISRTLMAAAAVAASFAILWTVWSRRPLAGVLIASAGLIYHFRIAGRSRITKFWFFGSLVAAVLLLTVYLEATRGQRFYSTAKSVDTFGESNLRNLFGGVEMNYRVYELALQEFPNQHPYLLGTGYVPGIIWFPRTLWPSKPVSTGYVLSQMWWNVDAVASSVGLPPMGEAYANFGIIGMLIILFLIGRIIRVLNTYLRIHYHNVIAWAAWLMVVPDIATEWRGDFTSMTAQRCYE